MRPYRTRLRRLRAVGAAALAIAALSFAGPAGATPSAPAADPPPAASMQAYGPNVTIQGHGFGHGIGMGQWGAFGYATTFGWSWQQILGHYYGGTVLGGVDPNYLMTVRLQALDDRPFSAFVQDSGLMATNADGNVGRFRSLVAVEAAQGVYDLYGRADAVICPNQAVAFDPAGWSLVKAGVPSSTASGAYFEAWVPGADLANAPVTSLLGSCQPDGSVTYYRGYLRPVNGSANENRTVNILPLEPYVRGVVPREMPASWGTAAGGQGINALRAQAVAARSFAYAGGNRYPYAKICDSQSCQVYGGAARKTSVGAGLTTIESATSNQATAETAGVVLAKAGAVVSAMYSSSTGGITAGISFPAVPDAGDAASPHHDWSVTIPVTTIQAKWPSIGTLLSIDVTQRNGLGEWGGRVLQLVLRGSAGSQTLTGDQLRIGLGLKSNWFYVPDGCAGRTGGTPPPAPAPTTFHPVSPARLVDSRIGLNSPVAKVPAGCVLPVAIAGAAGVPATGATAVSLNLTVTDAVAPGYATVYPCSAGIPATSNVNYGPGDAAPNLVTIPLDGDGYVCIYAQQAAHVIVDVFGWYGGSDGELFRALAPSRLADTRTRVGGQGRLPTNGVLDVPVVAAPAIPKAATVHAVALNVTTTGSGAGGFLTAYPCEVGPAGTSNVNFAAGQTVANQVVVAVGASGRVCVYASSSTEVIVDLLGWYGPSGGGAPGTRFVPTNPARLLDTRNAIGVPGTTPAGAGQTVVLGVAGRGGVPASGARSVTLNVTATGTQGAGYVTVHPCDQPLPLASNLNPFQGRTVPNLVTLPLAANGTVCLYTSTPTHLIADVFGYFMV